MSSIITKYKFTKPLRSEKGVNPLTIRTFGNEFGSDTYFTKKDLIRHAKSALGREITDEELACIYEVKMLFDCFVIRQGEEVISVVENFDNAVAYAKAVPYSYFHKTTITAMNFGSNIRNSDPIFLEDID